jgi:YebC/PmpR family DNA-binding regulatory protein
MYEGYGPGGVAIMIECLSDNRNRAASDVRVAVTRNGGNMADPGSVAYLFDRKGVVVVPKGSQVTEELLMEVTLDAGAQDIIDQGETFEILSESSDLVAVRTALQNAKIEYDQAESSFLPSMKIPISDAATAKKIFDLIDAIEELDDVQNVYGNFDVADEVIAQAASL